MMIPLSNNAIQTIQQLWNSIHNHFKWSKLDSMLPLKEAIKRAKDYGMTALAITDHGVIGGAIEFYNECIEQGIKPIIGMEIYLTEDHTIKTRAEMDKNGYSTYHLILYAKDNIGLGNLYHIASEAANNGYFDGYERIDLKYIRDNNLAEGIIATSACLGGPIAHYLLNEPKKHNKPEKIADPIKAREYASILKDTFEDFYIELGANNTINQKLVNQELMIIAKEQNIPLVISGDTHYLDKSDAKIHEVLLCMNTGSSINHPDRFKFVSDEFYLLHPDEVYDICITQNIPLEAMENTINIADMCNVYPLPINKNGLLPPFIVPLEYTEETYLYKLCNDALIELALKKPIDYVAYSKRLAYELEVICIKGYAGYFLILNDLISFCRRDPSVWTPLFEAIWTSRGYPATPIMTGPGRGSAAGALVSSLLHITKLDPLKWGLYFERFLDPDKDAFPDIDTDFEYLRRQEVIEYILYKYGVENVAQIITYGSVKLKGGVRRIMKVLDYTSLEQEQVAKCIPDKMPDQSDAEYGKFRDMIKNPDKYKDLYGEDKFNGVFNRVKEFWKYMDQYPDVSTALEKIEGCIATYGVHASGVVIAPPGKLLTSLPTKKFDSAPLLVCQFDMEHLDKVKALKLDVLGLKTLSVIDIACALAGIDKHSLDIENFDDYPEVFEYIRNGYTKEVFQFSSPGITRMVQDMQLDCFNELIDAAALYRPGPLTAVDDATGLTMVETYIKNKLNKTTSSIHKDLDEILAETKGCMVYQEQLMRVAQKIAGYTLSKADSNIRKPVGKKKIKAFPAIRQEFVYGTKDNKTGNIIVPGAIAMGYSEEFSNALFDMILKFGGLSA